jgi:hypothetical protein
MDIGIHKNYHHDFQKRRRSKSRTLIKDARIASSKKPQVHPSLVNNE